MYLSTNLPKRYLICILIPQLLHEVPHSLLKYILSRVQLETCTFPYKLWMEVFVYEMKLKTSPVDMFNLVFLYLLSLKIKLMYKHSL